MSSSGGCLRGSLTAVSSPRRTGSSPGNCVSVNPRDCFYNAAHIDHCTFQSHFASTQEAKL